MLLLQAEITAVSTDCLNVISLATNLNMDFNRLSQLQSNCCLNNGLTGLRCNENELVTEINWNSLGLNGILDVSLLPRNLISLALNNNQIFRIVDTDTTRPWPTGLTFIDLGACGINGTIPTNLPDGLNELLLYANRLHGNVPLHWPNSLKKLNLGENELSGSILDVTWPQGLLELKLYQNELTGPISYDLPSTLTLLDLGTNSMSGAIPSTLPSELKSLHIDYNQFDSTLQFLPSTVGDLSANNNQFSDVEIPSNQVFRRCDLRNNPFKNKQSVLDLPVGCEYSPFPKESTTLFLIPSTTRKVTTRLDTPLASASAREVTTRLDTPLASASARAVTTSEYLTTRSISAVVELKEKEYFSTISTTSSIVFVESNAKLTDLPISLTLIYALLGGFGGVCLLGFIASKIFKNPKMNSRFGRKNSFGTLNTVNFISKQ